MCVAHQVPLPIGFPRQEYWSGLPVPTPGHLPNPGKDPVSIASPTLADGFFTTVPPGKPFNNNASYGLPRWFSGKESACQCRDTGDMGLILGSGRSPGGGNGNPLQYSCLENPMDRGAWWAPLESMESQRVRHD